MDKRSGHGLVALLVVIAVVVLIYFGIQFQSKSISGVEDGPVIEQGLDAVDRAGDIRNNLNERNRELEEFQNDI